MFNSRISAGIAAVFAACILVACGQAPEGTAPAPPVTRVEAVTDTYHGTTVTDPYRWLEDWEAQEVKNGPRPRIPTLGASSPACPNGRRFISESPRS